MEKKQLIEFLTFFGISFATIVFFSITAPELNFQIYLIIVIFSLLMGLILWVVYKAVLIIFEKITKDSNPLQ
jgi:hypothetical protein